MKASSPPFLAIRSLAVQLTVIVVPCSNGKSTTGTFTDTYVSSKTTPEKPIAGELGVLADGWKIGMKQEPGVGNPGITLGITRPVLPYNGEKVPDHGAKGAGAKGGEGSPPTSDDEGSSATGSGGSTTPSSNDTSLSSPAPTSATPSSPTPASSTPSSPTSSSSPAGSSSPSPSSTSPDPSSSTGSSTQSSSSPSSPSAPSGTSGGSDSAYSASSTESSTSTGSVVSESGQQEVVPFPGDAANPHAGFDLGSSAFPG